MQGDPAGGAEYPASRVWRSVLSEIAIAAAIPVVLWFVGVQVLCLALEWPLMPLWGIINVPLTFIFSHVVMATWWLNGWAHWYDILPTFLFAAISVFFLSRMWPSPVRIGLVSVTFLGWALYALSVLSRIAG